MLRIGSWLAAKPKRTASTQSLNSLDESQYLEDALRAATHIMNDDVRAAEAELKKGNSSYHKLGRGIVLFIKATLGFEHEVMREASECLADAEQTASNDHRRAQRDNRRHHSAIYPPGSEFALCQAQSQLMAAVVGVLSESLTESLKGFYKLRKAYMTLDGILEAENTSLSNEEGGRLEATTVDKVEAAHGNGLVDSQAAENENERVQATSGQKNEEEVLDVGGKAEGSQVMEKSAGNQAVAVPEAEMKNLKIEPESNTGKTSTTQETDRLEGQSKYSKITHPVDIFIHSGASLCFGLLILMISMVPPAFAKLLSIVGFRGDRQRGLQMLWQTSSLTHVHGALAGLILLGFYNGIAGFCDILPDDTGESLEGYPARRLEALLTGMRKRYPHSRLWLLEEARLLASNRQLEEAVELLNGDISSQLKQIEALGVFERSLDLMYLHRYELTSQGFVKCVELNNWSHGLYYYIAGCAEVELYRKLLTTDPEEAARHAKIGTKLLRKVPAHTGKKRIMARQLPFDGFVLRKIQKWEHRAQERQIEFVDAIGVSPVEEMIYLWNGYKRMQPGPLQDSLDALAWSTTNNPHWEHEGVDERAIYNLLRAAVLRNLGRYDEARGSLQEGILGHDKLEFKGLLKDDWTCPSAHYEMAVLCWIERKQESKESEREKLKECGEWLEKAAKWESYELDARIGLKVKTAQITLQTCNDNQ